MNRPERMEPWRKRLLEGAGLEPRLEPGLQKELEEGLRDCVQDPAISERMARLAARRVLAELDGRHPAVGVSTVVSWGRSLFQPKRVLAALGVVLVLQIGGALAGELGPRALFVRIGNWFENHAASLAKRHHHGDPAPTIAAASDEAGKASQPSAAAAGTAVAKEFADGVSPAATGLVPPQGESTPIGGALVRRRLVAKPLRTESPAPAILPDSLESEAAVVSQAVSLASKDPRSALSLLTGYWRDFPAGALRGEAAIAEIGALQALEKHAEALALLDGWARAQFLGMNESGDELALTRLELMVDAGRCVEALPLLGRQLALPRTPRQRGRALLARAACKGKVGDVEGNRADLERYLKDFPNGSHAVQVRRALGIGD